MSFLLAVIFIIRFSNVKQFLATTMQVLDTKNSRFQKSDAIVHPGSWCAVERLFLITATGIGLEFLVGAHETCRPRNLCNSAYARNSSNEMTCLCRKLPSCICDINQQHHQHVKLLIRSAVNEAKRLESNVTQNNHCHVMIEISFQHL